MCEHKRQQQVSHLGLGLQLQRARGTVVAACKHCWKGKLAAQGHVRLGFDLRNNSKERPFHLQTFQRILLLSRNLRQVVSLSLLLGRWRQDYSGTQGNVKTIKSTVYPPGDERSPLMITVYT